MSKEMIH